MGLIWLATVAVLAPATGAPFAGLPAGPAVVVVAPAVVPEEDRASEAYADWVASLSDYLAARPRGLAVRRLAVARWHRLCPALARDRYATLFVRRDGRALTYSGMILEPEPYRAGGGWATGGPLPRTGPTGLRTVTAAACRVSPPPGGSRRSPPAVQRRQPRPAGPARDG